MKEFNDWHDIKKWMQEHGFNSIANRMQVNNDCWNSCGEFGRSQVFICDNMRFCRTEEERLEMAYQIDDYYSDDIMTDIYNERENR